jgi:hypothetical protein
MFRSEITSGKEQRRGIKKNVLAISEGGRHFEVGSSF